MAGGEGKRGVTLWVVLVCIIAAMGSSYTMLRFMGGGKSEAPVGTVGAEVRGPVYEVGEFTVDLVPEGRSHLLRVSVSLQTVSQKVEKELEGRSAEVKDIIVTILRNRTPSSITGRQGMDSLRREIRDSINNRIIKGGISEVYLPDFVMQ